MYLYDGGSGVFDLSQRRTQPITRPLLPNELTENYLPVR